ncbi:MAG: hypothetical protein ACK40K_05340, partial [Raineya sp.]
TAANNARIMAFSALIDLNPDENSTNSRFKIAVDGEELENFDGSEGVVWNRQFRLDANGQVQPLPRKFPLVSRTQNISVVIAPATTPSPQTSQYIPAANAPFTAAQTAFTNFLPASPATILNGVEVVPAVQERGTFIPAGRRNITFRDREGKDVASSMRVNANLNGGSLTSIYLRGRLGVTSGADQQGVTTITESIPSPGANAAIRFINLAPDLGEVQMLTAGTSSPAPYNVNRRPLLTYPNPPSGTRFRFDNLLPTKLDSLRATRDSLMSRRSYNALNATVRASQFSSITIERTSDGAIIPNYSNSLNFTSYTNLPAGTYTFNFYAPRRAHTAGVLANNIPFNFVAGGVYNIILHGTATTGYKCDIIRMN